MDAHEGTHLRDVDLVQRCLEGDDAAVEELRGHEFASLSHVLLGSGATPTDVEDLLSGLLAECVVGRNGCEPLLARYTGRSPLAAWLRAIAVNRWISLKRSLAARSRAVDRLAAETTHSVAFRGPSEIRRILSQAVKSALAACDSETLVLLQLIHVHKLRQRQICGVWGWDQSKMSRRMKEASDRISSAILHAIKEADPLLEIRWEDVLELCEAESILAESPLEDASLPS